MKIMSKSVMLLSMALLLFSALAKAADVGIAALESQIDDLLGDVDAENDKMDDGDLSNIQKVYDNLASAQELILQTPADSGTGRANRYYLGVQYKNLAEHYSNMDNFSRAKDILASTDSKLQWKKLALSDEQLQQLDFDRALQDMQEREKKTKAPAPGKPDASVISDFNRKIDKLEALIGEIEDNIDVQKNLMRARNLIEEMVDTKDIGKIVDNIQAQDFLNAWLKIGQLYINNKLPAVGKVLLKRGAKAIETFEKLSPKAEETLGEAFNKETGGKEEPEKPAVPGGAGDSLERQQRQKARDFIEEAQKIQAGKGALTDAEFEAIDDKYYDAIALFDRDEWRGYGFDILVDAYTARIDLHEKNKRFIKMLSFEIPVGRIRDVGAKITPDDIARIKLEGYDAKKEFARYKALPGQLTAAVQRARAELAKPFDAIALKFATDDIAVLEQAINEYNALVENVDVNRIAVAMQDSVKAYLEANLKVIDSYLTTKNLPALKAFGWRGALEKIGDTDIAEKQGADAKRELSKRYSAFKTLEQTPKTPEPGAPVDSAVLRDALQNLANALDSVQGNLK